MSVNETVEGLYNGPVVDAHHHFWQPSNRRYPWLLPGVAIPFRYGIYDAIKKDYLPPDLLRDAQGLNLVGSVAMEGEWDLADPIGEIKFLEQVKSAYGLPNAAVAHAVLRDPDIERTLDEIARHSLIRAVRNKPGQAESAATAKNRPTLLEDPQWQRGYALLKKFGLHFELQTAWWHLDSAARLAAKHPDIAMIINHAGLPSDRSQSGLSGWLAAIQGIARLPNVYMKISGIGIPGKPWSAENNRVIVDGIFEAFGAERIMFASNFPVDGLVGTYAQIFNGFKILSRTWTRGEQENAFYKTAARLYRLDLPASRSTAPGA